MEKAIKVLNVIVGNPIVNLVLFYVYMLIISIQLLVLLFPNLFLEMAGRKGFFIFPNGIPDKLILVDKSCFAKL